MARKRRRSSGRGTRVKGYSYMRGGKRIRVKGHSRKR
jgi:hypothetical protein